jgi:hypothetical protein
MERGAGWRIQIGSFWQNIRDTVSIFPAADVRYFSSNSGSTVEDSEKRRRIG